MKEVKKEGGKRRKEGEGKKEGKRRGERRREGGERRKEGKRRHIVISRHEHDHATVHDSAGTKSCNLIGHTEINASPRIQTWG